MMTRVPAADKNSAGRVSDRTPYLPLLRYHPAMVPPRWPDEQGRPLPTYPCPRCGRETPVRFKGFRVEHLKHVGWQLYRPETYVSWCGHGQEVIPVPLADRRVTFVPVLGEAR